MGFPKCVCFRGVRIWALLGCAFELCPWSVGGIFKILGASWRLPCRSVAASRPWGDSGGPLAPWCEGVNLPRPDLRVLALSPSISVSVLTSVSIFELVFILSGTGRETHSKTQIKLTHLLTSLCGHMNAAKHTNSTCFQYHLWRKEKLNVYSSVELNQINISTHALMLISVR